MVVGVVGYIVMLFLVVVSSGVSIVVSLGNSSSWLGGGLFEGGSCCSNVDDILRWLWLGGFSVVPKVEGQSYKTRVKRSNDVIKSISRH